MSTTTIAPPEPTLSAEKVDAIAGGALVRWCGQAYNLDEPDWLPDGLVWKVPVWSAHQELGRLDLIGEIVVDDASGKALFPEEEREAIRLACRKSIRKALGQT